LAEVRVCGRLFKSSQVKLKKVDAEQDAAKLAFEYLQQQVNEEEDCTKAAGENRILQPTNTTTATNTEVSMGCYTNSKSCVVMEKWQFSFLK